MMFQLLNKWLNTNSYIVTISNISLLACTCCQHLKPNPHSHATWTCILVVKPLGNLFPWVACAGQTPRSAVAPDGGSLDPVCCVLGVKRRRSRADVCSHRQPDFKSSRLYPSIPQSTRVPGKQSDTTVKCDGRRRHLLFCSCFNSCLCSLKEE